MRDYLSHCLIAPLPGDNLIPSTKITCFTPCSRAEETIVEIKKHFKCVHFVMSVSKLKVSYLIHRPHGRVPNTSVLGILGPELEPRPVSSSIHHSK